MLRKFFLFFCIFLFGVAGKAEAATLYLSSPANSYVVGRLFSVYVSMNTSDRLVNTAEVSINYSADKIEFVSGDIKNSVFEFWVKKPMGQSGTVSFLGGLPKGINSSKALLAVLTFRAKKIGKADFNFADNSKVLLNDGKATDALDNKVNLSLNIIDQAPAQILPSMPKIKSLSHPDSSKWYAERNISLEWICDKPADGFSYVLDNYTTTTPDNVSEGLETNIVLSDIADGIYYFHIKSGRGGKWSEVSHYEVKIDASGPIDLKLNIFPEKELYLEDGFYFDFSAKDNLSGLDYQEIIIKSKEDGKILEGEKIYSERGFYAPKKMAVGNYLVIVESYDKVGNFSEISKEFSVREKSCLALFEKKIFSSRDKFIASLMIFVLVISILIISLIRRGGNKDREPKI